MDAYIKQETVEAPERLQQSNGTGVIICLNSCSSSDGSSSDESDDISDVRLNPNKKRRMEALLPAGFLDPISPPGYPKRTVSQPTATANGGAANNNSLVTVKRENIDKANYINSVPVNERKAAKAIVPISAVAMMPSCRQFWKAGDYEGCGGGVKLNDEEMDHVRVHPKFLHSNATSHKWALGAFAELLDNALDETCNGATYVDVDVLESLKYKTKMVVVQDNGGGMTPDKMRQCMSLGYSAKSKMANTIGQYGNGFKTSTMRLGADVIVFSRCEGKYGGRAKQSIGLLSFTFLRSTGKEDIVVPMVDYERRGNTWSKFVRSSSDNWQRNLETVVQWSPYETEEELLQQFNFLSEKGTRIIIYNLWEDDEGKPELDFDTDQHDIQIGGNERDGKKMKTAKDYSSTMHYLTYRNSLRSYASILYRRLPRGFRIIIRGKDVVHHDITTDLIHIETNSYKPAAYADIKDPNMSASVTLGFVKDAEHHFDIQGFNVYHKNRLIKPFWRVWNAAGSDGRGVIGVLEANFIEPAHDKQGFERTVALSRLEQRLVHFQKTYWSTKCQLIGYAQRRHAKSSVTPHKKAPFNIEENEPSSRNGSAVKSSRYRGHRTAGVSASETRDPEAQCATSHNNNCARPQSDRAAARVNVETQGSDGDGSGSPSSDNMVLTLKQENESLRHQNETLQNELEHTKKMMTKMDEEQEIFVSVFAEERGRRDVEEESLRKRLKDASDTIRALLDKVKKLEAARD